MKKSKNEIYSLIDEDFLSEFSGNHLDFMKEVYYKYYVTYCGNCKRKPLSKPEFYTNMHKRRIQLYQMCCPYCGTLRIILLDKKTQGDRQFNYCSKCGKGSTIENVKQQLARFIRIHNVNSMGLKELKKKNIDCEEWILSYDCYQMEIIELASIIEVVFRDYFEALLFINRTGEDQTYADYVKKIIDKNNGNNFMNIEKANVIYKKVFEINIKECIDTDVWNDLTDITNLRNMMIHNNGMIDGRFKTTPSYCRLKSHINGDLFILKEADVRKYFGSVLLAVTSISNIFSEKYCKCRSTAIANYYFNH